MDVYAIHVNQSETAGAGAWEATFTIGEVDMYSLEEMIWAVRMKLSLGDGRLDNLYLFDHGIDDPIDKLTRLYFGSDQVSRECFDEYQAAFRALGALFPKTGVLHLMHCYAGKDRALLRLIAETTGVTVIGGSGPTKAVFDSNSGDWVTCTPNGTCYWSIYKEKETILSATRVRVVNPQPAVKVALPPASQPAKR